MKPFWKRIQEGQIKGHVSIAIRFKEGWIWFDEFGKDYGPWASKKEATVLGPAHAKLEVAGDNHVDAGKRESASC